MTRRAVLSVSVAALIAAAVVATAGLVLRRADERRAEARRLVAEVVNDHLRVLASARPAEVESADASQLESWLASHVGFAPAVPAAPGTALAPWGVAVGYVLDRKAAVVLYRLRLHRVTLLAFRAEGLPWPGEGSGAAAAPLARASERGFHAVLWRARDVGYALVSDSNPEELAELAQRLASGARGEVRR